MSAAVARSLFRTFHLTRKLQTAAFSRCQALPKEVRHILSNDDFIKNVVNSPQPVVVTFHAEWCEPCKLLLPKLRSLIEPVETVELAVVDVEKHPELVENFEVKAVPAVVAMRNGMIVHKFIGLVDDTMIATLMEKLTGGKAS